jgi:hypothetical protein
LPAPAVRSSPVLPGLLSIRSPSYMDYVTRQFINLTKKFRKESRKALELLQRQIKKHSEAVSAANELNHQRDETWQGRFNEVRSEYQQAKRNKSASDERHYRVQNSIRWAGWATFAAAFFYGAITYLQWQDAHKNFIINQRAWVGIDRPISVDSFASDGKLGGKIGYTITLKNFGNSIATDVAMSSEPVSAIDKIEPAADYACELATSFSRLRGAKIANPSGIDYPKKISGGIIFPGEWLAYGMKDTDIQTGKTEWAVTIVGCIVYKDQFAKERHTHFCYGGTVPPVKAPTFFYQCPIGNNEAD